ncbi:MAG: hypothetical protein VKM97_07375 [Cyanobacteriota bacterium]|nr:hypothetical protein [Cyanobacteriota bacterium]
MPALLQSAGGAAIVDDSAYSGSYAADSASLPLVSLAGGGALLPPGGTARTSDPGQATAGGGVLMGKSLLSDAPPYLSSSFSPFPPISLFGF